MLKVYKQNDIKIKREIDGEFNLYWYCIPSGFKKIGTIDEEERSDILINLNYI